MIEILRRMMSGVAWGAIFTFVALSFLMFYDINPPVSTIWLYMLASFVLGIYFGLASFIFEREEWSPLQKTIVHFSLSITVYFIIAIPIGWIIFKPLSIIITFFIFILTYLLFYFSFHFYYKKVEASLNESLHKK